MGAVLCECCKNNILQEEWQFCPLCQQKIARLAESGTTKKAWQDYCCAGCDLLFEAIFVGGWREGALAKLVAEYKYQAVRAAGNVLVEVLEVAIPQEMPAKVVIVPLPTIGRHVRERGLDHTLMMAKKLARQRGWKCERVLVRAADTVQVGSKVAERQDQAKRAYAVGKRLDPETCYLLLDDVWTTGASMIQAAKTLRRAGAKQVMGVVVAVSKVRDSDGK